MRSSLKKQQGFLMIVAVILIVVIGFLGVAISYMSASSSAGTINYLLGDQALYLAESGFEQATHQLMNSTLANRTACSGLTISNTVGVGAYNVTSTGPFSVSSPTTLSNAVTATATTIPVISTSGYQNSGRIIIDQEWINYASIDSTNFIGVTRGIDGTSASIHALGTRIGQYQCHLSSQGGVPSLSPSANMLSGKRLLTESIQLQEGWAVGNNLSGALWNVIHWNNPNEKSWTQQTIAVSPPQILTAVSIISNVDAWVVGNKASAIHYNGSTWTLTNTGITGGDNLTSVSAVSSQEVWTCADQGKIYKWTPSTNWTSPANP
jgi:MSHA biogenesis protein MshP